MNIQLSTTVPLWGMGGEGVDREGTHRPVRCWFLNWSSAVFISLLCFTTYIYVTGTYPVLHNKYLKLYKCFCVSQIEIINPL